MTTDCRRMVFRILASRRVGKIEVSTAPVGGIPIVANLPVSVESSGHKTPTLTHHKTKTETAT